MISPASAARRPITDRRRCSCARPAWERSYRPVRHSTHYRRPRRENTGVRFRRPSDSARGGAPAERGRSPSVQSHARRASKYRGPQNEWRPSERASSQQWCCKASSCPYRCDRRRKECPAQDRAKRLEARGTRHNRPGDPVFAGLAWPRAAACRGDQPCAAPR